MSENLVYEPITPTNERILDISACQVRTCLHRLYGEYPIILTKENIPQLETLQAVNPGEYGDNYVEIIKAIKMYPDGIKLYEVS